MRSGILLAAVLVAVGAIGPSTGVAAGGAACHVRQAGPVVLRADRCWSRDGRGWRVAGPVLANGIRLAGGGSIVVRDGAARSTGSRTWKVGPVPVARARLDAGNGGQVVGAAVGAFGRLPLRGEVAIRFLARGRAQLTAQALLPLPRVFLAETGALTVVTSDARRGLEQARLRLGEVSVWRLALHDLSLAYVHQKAHELWSGGFELGLPFGAVKSLGLKTLWRDGRFASARGSLGIVPVPIVAGVTLNGGSLELTTRPAFRVRLDSKLAFGPTFGRAALLAGTGSVAYTPLFDVGAGADLGLRDDLKRLLGAVGGRLELALGAALRLDRGAVLDVVGNLDVSLFGAGVRVHVSGFASARAMNLEGTAKIGLSFANAQAEALVSSVGTAGCLKAKAFFVSHTLFGAGYRWGERTPHVFGSCKLGDYRVATPAAGGYTFTVDQSAPFLVVSAISATPPPALAPEFQLRGPDGTVVDTLSGAASHDVRAAAPRSVAAAARAAATATGTTFRIGSPEPDGPSGDPAISADGRLVAFESTATNLVPGDVNGASDVFVYDRTTRKVELISAGPDGSPAAGASDEASISADGNVVAFRSTAANLVPKDDNGAADVFVWNRAKRTMTRASVAPDGTSAAGPSSAPVLSATGRYVAFVSAADSLVAGDADGAPDTFVRDLTLGRTQLVSVGPSGAAVGPSSGRPSISGDGSSIAFTAGSAAALVRAAAPTSYVFVRDRVHGTTELASVDSTGRAGRGCESPSLSADGRRIAFECGSLGAVAVHGVFVHDRGGATVPASVAADGTPVESAGPSLAPDGGAVAFETVAPLVPDANAAIDVYVRTVPASVKSGLGAPARASVASDGGEGGAASYAPALANGGYVAFASAASNLVPGDGNRAVDVFLRTPTPDATPPAISAPSFSVNPVAKGVATTVSATATDDASGVAGGEYFVDADPGVGKGTPMTLAGATLGAPFTATVSGARTVFVRARDAAGNWSAPASASLSVFNPALGGYSETPTQLVLEDAASGTGYAAVTQPAQGTWTVVPSPGASVSEVRFGYGLPQVEPLLKASVTGSGATRVLHWTIAGGIAGQRVTFASEGATIAGDVVASGSRSFAAAVAPGNHDVVAAVSYGGLPNEQFVAARYTVPPPVPPPRPTRPSATRTAGAAVFRWHGSAPGGWRVRISSTSGRLALVTLRPGQRSIRVPAQSRQGVTVTVAAYSLRGAAGKTVSIRSAARR